MIKMNNYDYVNWYHVYRIERLSLNEIKIQYVNKKYSIYTFKDSKECLDNFLHMKNLRRRAHGTLWKIKP